MLVEKITSRQNPLVKRFRRVRAGGERPHVFLEGTRLIEDAVATGARFDCVVFTAELSANERGAAVLDLLRGVQCRGALVSGQVMEAIADTRSPQGIAAIVSRPFFELDNLFALAPNFLVIADELQYPGNLGTKIRTAEAAGASGLITTRYTVDAFSDKAIRGSMGSALRLPIVTDSRVEDVIARCRAHNFKIIASAPASARPTAVIEDAAAKPRHSAYTRIDLTGPIAIIFGKVGSGVPLPSFNEADELVNIPMADGVESLNVAAAAAILLYEAARQRGFEFKRSVESTEGDR
jgi:TrmH family RNA methyltransferase